MFNPSICNFQYSLPPLSQIIHQLECRGSYLLKISRRNNCSTPDLHTILRLLIWSTSFLMYYNFLKSCRPTSSGFWDSIKISDLHNTEKMMANMLVLQNPILSWFNWHLSKSWFNRLYMPPPLFMFFQELHEGSKHVPSRAWSRNISSWTFLLST